MLFTFVGNFFNASYRNGVFGEVGVVIWQNTINLTFLMITLCVSHIFGSIIKSVEDIIEHPLFSRKNAKLDAGIFYKN